MFVAPIKITITNYNGPIKIGNFLIRKIKPAEQEKFFGIKDLEIKWNEIWFTYSIGKYSDIQWYNSESIYHKCITCEYVVESPINEYLHSYIQYLLFAFRIYKLWEIFAPLILHSKNPGLTATQPYFTRIHKPYIIDSNEIIKIEQILKSILWKVQTKDPQFLIIFNRFNIAINDISDIEGSFADLVSILEILLLPTESTNEILFRFSLYWSYKLNSLWLNTSFEEIKNLYDRRSKIVHWREIKNLETDYERLFELTITLIKEYCDNGTNNETIKKEILEKLNIENK